MTDAYGVYPGECIVAGVVTEDPELCISIEETDSRIMPNIAIACEEESKSAVVMSNDTDVVICSLTYHQRFCELEIPELWVKFGVKDAETYQFTSLGNNLMERSVQLC